MRIILTISVPILMLLQIGLQPLKHSDNFSKHTRIDSLFIEWNDATLASLKQQERSACDSSIKGHYLNRFEAMIGYWDISDKAVNKASIRFLLLKELMNKIGQGDIYLIEANESGETVLIRTFVLYPTPTGKFDIEVFTWTGKGWNILGSIANVQLSVSKDFNQYLVGYGKGRNYEDIIATYIHKSSIKTSTYFLFGTLKGAWYYELLNQWNSLNKKLK